ncbi:MAG: CoA transferase [Gammaproteobacteria bacterium]|nr:CoA transferase [Gammaproteobacteria bacterium]MBT8151314.1 CoA transferase [Gammaproteobacteria bacterium]NND38085.1 CoA transferase [Pseudomonadales bacterium]NNM10891.1 CoA transferase [Pseudomonadales bacterium]RZV50953.1 MAG: CoA transferase [Pseudomonadales bacterium]
MGPLSGIKIIEIKGIGPGPYAGMLLADMGAEVIVVERSSQPGGIGLPTSNDPNSRGKRSIVLNLKTPEGVQALLKLVEQSDAIFEGYRPGVAERLGFGPDVCLARNPKIVFGRMTGWGQSGPLSKSAGHDINYISLTGSLAAMGTADKPMIPLNLVGDYAGGSLFLVMGMLASIIEAQRTGKGQVVDAAITDGSASLMSMFYGMTSLGAWQPKRASNMLDGAAHFYDTYTTSDNKHISVGAIEPQFYAELRRLAGLDEEAFDAQHDAAQWPALKEKMAAVIAQKTRDEWAAIFEGSDACVAPILDYTEAPSHPHNIARETYIELGGVMQPGTAPKFSGSTNNRPAPPVAEGSSTKAVLAELGYSNDEIAAFAVAGATEAQLVG